MNENQPHNHEENAGSETTPTPERTTPLHPQIWVGSLADYNNGRLIGDWLDAAVDDDELIGGARAILATSETPGAEEWAIFDYEDFGTWKPGESEDLAVVARVARGILEHGPAFAAWAELHDAEPDMLEAFTDSYLGEYDSPSAWAETGIEDLGFEGLLDKAVPDAVRGYVRIDYAAVARDAWLSGDIYVVQRPGGGVWIFDSRP